MAATARTPSTRPGSQRAPAAVTGGDFDFADPVDVETLPWPRKGKGSDVDRMRAAKPGERNDLLNRLAFARAQGGENMGPLRTAALASGLTVAEVSATVASAEQGAKRGGLTVAKGGNEGRPTKGGNDAQETALRMAPAMRNSAIVRFYWARMVHAGAWGRPMGL